MKKLAIAAAVAATITGSIAGVANACTTVVYNNGDAAISMRTMDWFGHDDARVVGDGVGIEQTYADTQQAVTSKSKYASMKIESFLPGIVAEALNEKGLEAHMLYLGDDYTSFPEPTKAKPDVDALNLVEWAVDNYKTVPEVVSALQTIDVTNSGVCGLPPANDMNHCKEVAPVHFQFADAHGNTAVVEFVGGEMQIYQEDGSAYMSNDPEFSYHLTLDKEQTEAGATIRAYDRRLRGKAVLEDMYQRDVKDLAEAKNSIKAAGATVFAGYNQVDPYVNDVFPTLWTIYTDRLNGEWILDRYDTWQAERYSFEMFDNDKAERQPLGIHPQPQHQQ